MLRKVTTQYGEIRGVASGDPRVTVFKGVPFAKPPIGELRWRSPEKPEPWEGVLQADRFPDMAWQNAPGQHPDTDFYDKELNPAAQDWKMSEDCLYLNVWTPARSAAEKYPVYIWIHGGGYSAGYSYEMEFDGEKMARQGIVFVTVGYRLNVFGFLAHPELVSESPGMPIGNQGVEDQTAAIAWVKENISAFGGDPEKITIGGQSAGAGSVLTQMITPMSRGLYQRAITQSGGGLRTIGYGHIFRDKEAALRDGEAFFRHLGVNSLEEARALPASAVFEGFRTFHGETRGGPTLDGIYLVEEGMQAFLNDHQHPVDYLCGFNAGEVPGAAASGVMPETIEAFETMVRSRFGEQADEILAAANVKNVEDARNLIRTNETFQMRAISTRAWALAEKVTGRKTWFYRFDVSIPGEDNPGAFHGAELWFVFNSLGRCWRPFTGKHYDLARQISGYWINFIKTGDPNGCDMNGNPLPEWKISGEDISFQLLEDTIRPEEGWEPDPIMRAALKHYGLE